MSADAVDALVHAGMTERAARAKRLLFDAVEQQVATVSGERLRWFVPGRIEVLGKHTDYAGGRSLVCAAEQGFCIAAVGRHDAIVRITDVRQQLTVATALAGDLEMPASGWTVYPAVVARRIARNFGAPLRGADIAFASDLPAAAGMSSSSALVVSTFAVLSAINRLADREEYTASIRTVEDLAGYLACIENGQTYGLLAGDSGVGTFGGSEDHVAILAARAGQLSQYSFCPARLERTVTVPGDCRFVVAVSGVIAEKAAGARSRYNRASNAVRSIVDRWRAASGANADTLAESIASSPDAVDGIRAILCDSGEESAWLVNRFEQFLFESETVVPRAAEALARSDMITFGEIVDRSQRAAEELLGNQVPETVWLAREARSLGAIAASAFGAGFGGSVWALVHTNESLSFVDRWRDAYRWSGHDAARNSDFLVTAAGPRMIRV